MSAPFGSWVSAAKTFIMNCVLEELFRARQSRLNTDAKRESRPTE